MESSDLDNVESIRNEKEVNGSRIINFVGNFLIARESAVLAFSKLFLSTLT